MDKNDFVQLKKKKKSEELWNNDEMCQNAMFLSGGLIRFV